MTDPVFQVASILAAHGAGYVRSHTELEQIIAQQRAELEALKVENERLKAEAAPAAEAPAGAAGEAAVPEVGR